MTKLLNTLLLTAIIAFLYACSRDIETDAVKRLESTFLDKERYNQAFIEKTGILRNQLTLCPNEAKKWEIANALYQEYHSYDIDSAQTYSDMMMQLAGTPEQKVASTSSQASCLCALRMYSSAEKLLNAIDTAGFNDRMYQSYYNAYIAYYTALGNEFDTDRSKARQNIRNRYIYQEKSL